MDDTDSRALFNKNLIIIHSELRRLENRSRWIVVGDQPINVKITILKILIQTTWEWILNFKVVH